MRFSEIWLREWVNISCNSSILVEQMTMAGIEVETVNKFTDDFNGVVIGKIVHCKPHPKADYLKLTTVDIGKNNPLNIVCGAANCRLGIKVAVATVGALLPGNLKIKKRYIRDEISEGMLCSFSELGIINPCTPLIIELPENAPISTNIREYLKLDDNIIDIKITPNRADCLSILGIAREIAILNKTSIIEPNISPVKATTKEIFPIYVTFPASCPRYLSRVIQGININAHTPLSIKEKLRRSGIYAIDPVVDITNYVLLELGQPMHAFDLDQINENIFIRMAQEGEGFVLLNGNIIKLHSDTLVVSDIKKILALAGISGGQQASINKYTKNIILECAYFNPLAIIGRARRYGLNTNASHRYERGVDPELQYKAIERATQLILDICGGKAGPIIDKTHQDLLPLRITINLRRSKLDNVIGYSIENQLVISILQSIGCEVTQYGDQWTTVVPSWRSDLTIEEDLIEEVARLYGYNNIPNRPIKINLVMGKHNGSKISLRRVKELLVDKGYQEAITYSFVNPKIQTLLHPNEEAIIIPKPISKEMSVMRLSLWTGLVSAVLYNQNRQQSYIRLFETGLCFIPDKNNNLGIRQEFMIGGILTGSYYKENWDHNNHFFDFYDLKGDLESVLELSNKLNDIEFRPSKNPALHPGKSAGIYLREHQIGLIGEISPILAHQLNINNSTFIFELIWDRIIDRISPKARDISRFPANHRDICVIVPETVPAGDIIKVCKKVNIDQIIDVKIFDVYHGNNINKGYKSLAISLIIQDSNGTLEEKEIMATVSRCVAALEKKFQAILR
ncbi:phenylalanine--tRNA ligase subunit beta [Candidatus Ishikawella capsulata]|uniref:Phenylalanine--tRNA ligase beta subunit n=1 Tax=Candidatus Ishikawaella capsulata Mpkobe TaxID=476281 RepID=C5WD63_9ENTR|nr:phenylalanine--tRNA ligase subunit beta [Candidatus Ishikawaella capsulata]BAH83269.1 phenylalanyl-tRNA synthetase beta subunit [Candidatus Ishikawaella capsulata Mpkobe]